MNLFYQPFVHDGILYLTPEESKHCVRVLRKKAGDTLTVTDGRGFFYDCAITDANPQQCKFIIKDTRSESERNHHVHLAISPTKNDDRIEWLVEKATEVGVDQISLIVCEHSERRHVKLDRLQKVAISAMKQSVKATLPVITGPEPISAFLKNTTFDEKFIAYVDFENDLHLMGLATPGKRYGILVGPEGDFTKQELSAALESGYKKVSLGNSRLRTETAGLVACTILNLINR